VHSEDTSNVASKKSSVNQNLAANEQSGGLFWLQPSPVLFLVLPFLLNFISRIILAPLLRAIEKELGVTTGKRDRYPFSSHWAT
jgi:hypothetical protein